MGSERVFEVCWADSTFPKDFLCESEDNGQYFVVIEGEEWPVASCEPVANDGGIELCQVRWHNSLKAERDLRNATQLIADFDARQNEQANAQLNNGIADSIESSPSPPSETPLSSVADDIEDGLPLIPALKFRPQGIVEYYAKDFRDVHARVNGEKCDLVEKWNKLIHKRPVIFNEKYLRKVSEYNLGRREKRQAFLIQMAGVEQYRQCEYCSNGFGPFIGCKWRYDMSWRRQTYRFCDYRSIVTPVSAHYLNVADHLSSSRYRYRCSRLRG